MDYQVIFTEPARDDLRAIVAFIAQDSPQRALTFPPILAPFIWLEGV